MNEAAAYPKIVAANGGEILLREMTRADEAEVCAFSRSLPAHDLLFVARDITNPKVITAWGRAIETGAIWTLLAFEGADLVGCAGLIRDPLSWSPHVGELRVLVAPRARAKGLGRVLIREAFCKALLNGLEKLVAQMTVDQTGAITIFEEFGFRGEALLREHVRDRNSRKHDIVILSHDAVRVRAQLDAYHGGGEE